MNAPAKQPVQVSCSIDAPPEVVFDAWLDPELIRRWMFHAPNEICQVSSDGVVGGAFSIIERAGGEVIDHYGRYLEFQRPNKLVYSLRVPKHFSGESLVTVGIEPAVHGCDVTLTHTGVVPEDIQHVWRHKLESLALMCAEPS
ncbi:MAG TPA: SRPBCC domain-containing protein [Polyangiales bacterium]|nr:SRPBCC domain-containing protein [Polyangiales bacterium]